MIINIGTRVEIIKGSKRGLKGTIKCCGDIWYNKMRVELDNRDVVVLSKLDVKVIK